MALSRITATPSARFGMQLDLRAPVTPRDARQRPDRGPFELGNRPRDEQRTDHSPERSALQLTTTAP